jgi:hypothetical protein
VKTTSVGGARGYGGAKKTSLSGKRHQPLRKPHQQVFRVGGIVALVHLVEDGTVPLGHECAVDQAGVVRT